MGIGLGAGEGCGAQGNGELALVAAAWSVCSRALFLGPGNKHMISVKDSYQTSNFSSRLTIYQKPL